jgi:uncharacterized protein YbjT (DUF2867 family)
MSSTALNVLVFGGTGSQARPTVRHLLARGHQPYVLTRNPDKAADLVAAGAKVAVGELNDAESLRRASQGMDAVALLIPAFLDRPQEAGIYGSYAVEAAKAAGVELIVWNTSGPMPEQRTGNPMNDSRLDLLDQLRASGIGTIVIEPTTYMENWLGPWTAAPLMRDDRLAYPVLADRKMGWIASDDVGALVVTALERPELSGQQFKVSGVEAVTGPELAALFSQALGRTISYYAMSPEEMGAVIDELFGPGAGDAVAESYRKDQQSATPTPGYHDMLPVLARLPVRMTTITEWVSAHAQAFGAGR